MEQLYKVSSPCLDDHQFKQEELESFGKLPESLLTNFLEMACTWHELEDQTFCGQSRSLRDQSQNGLGHVTDDLRGWLLTFITQTNSDNIALIIITDWVYSKTQTLLATLMTQNQPLVECCVFLEVEHLFQSVGCAGSKLLSGTVLQSLESFLSMLDYAWMGYLLSISGTWDWSSTFNQQCSTQTYKDSGNWCDSSFQNQGPDSQKT